MQRREIIITIENGGKMGIEKKGFSGTECKEALKELNDLVKIIDKKPTADIYKRPQQVQERQHIQ